MIFRDIDFSQYFKILDIRRSILPPQNIVSKKIPGGNRSVFVKQEDEEDIIEVDIEVMESTRVLKRSKIREVASKLHGKELAILILSDEPDKYDLAILTADTELKEIYTIGTTTLKFLRPEPRSYGDVIYEVLDGTILNNNGTYESKNGIITVQFNSNSTYLEITLLDTGEFLYIEHDFIIGDEVVIDLKAESIKKNGYLIMDDLYLESDFFSIPSGDYEISINPIDLTAALSYIERWL